MTNLKDNFLHLSNRERKMFLERFVKEIKVEKVGGDVVINETNFSQDISLQIYVCHYICKFKKIKKIIILVFLMLLVL